MLNNPPLARPVRHPLLSPLLSRRRARSRGPTRSQTKVPDWVWGAGLGAIVLIFVGGFFFFSNITGGSGGTCDNPLKPIPNVETRQADADGFQQTDVDLTHMSQFLQQNDLNAASALFYNSPSHNFMHTADPVIAQTDATLGKNLCNAVVRFEIDFDDAQRGQLGGGVNVLVSDLSKVQNYLRDGAEALGFPRPSG